MDFSISLTIDKDQLKTVLKLQQEQQSTILKGTKNYILTGLMF